MVLFGSSYGFNEDIDTLHKRYSLLHFCVEHQYPKKFSPTYSSGNHLRWGVIFDGPITWGLKCVGCSSFSWFNPTSCLVHSYKLETKN